jgi:hypothetical protein
VSPKRADFVLASHIPDSEADVLVFHSLNIESCAKRLDGRKVGTVPMVGMVVTMKDRLAKEQSLEEKSSHQSRPISICTYKRCQRHCTNRGLGPYRIVVFPAASRPTIRIRISIKTIRTVIHRWRAKYPSCQTSWTITSRLGKSILLFKNVNPINH